MLVRVCLTCTYLLIDSVRVGHLHPMAMSAMLRYALALCFAHSLSSFISCVNSFVSALPSPGSSSRAMALYRKLVPSGLFIMGPDVVRLLSLLDALHHC